MHFLQYQSLAKRTEKPLPFKEALQHGMLGVITEAGELGDNIKRHVIYGAPMTIADVAEEIGDVLWYLAVIANACGLDMDNIAEQNITKLRARYPEKYTDSDAVARADKS